ncbi:Uncharacterized protein Adt_13068 [Abeliophyllum distichum]|uniref:DUF7054 domain-containing protein n=1 Tax=Abeliophyllum distichum TaxID=126358 RepID=A0ABD1TVR3_9LAMI
MSERDLRRRIPAYRRATSRSRAGKPSPSPSPAPLNIRRSRPPVCVRSRKPSENLKILRRSKSEPLLLRGGGGEGDRNRTAVEEEEDEGVLYRPQTCTDIFSSPENLVPRSPNFERYNKDSKVVVNVTVEGSPGPIRTMVKLGSNVEEMIKLVIRKYNSEGRTPNLDKDFASRCELHHSYFSLECLNKSDVIGDVGSRSFYLRKCRSDQVESTLNTDIVPMNASNFITRKTNKIIRRTQKLWKLLGCI